MPKNNVPKPNKSPKQKDSEPSKPKENDEKHGKKSKIDQATDLINAVNKEISAYNNAREMSSNSKQNDQPAVNPPTYESVKQFSTQSILDKSSHKESTFFNDIFNKKNLSSQKTMLVVIVLAMILGSVTFLFTRHSTKKNKNEIFYQDYVEEPDQYRESIDSTGSYHEISI